MPTYEYRCPAGHDFERFFRKFSDATVELPCPECGATALRRVSGGAGLLFKGSGFYITDYGKDGKGPKKAADTGGDAKSGEAAAAGEKSGSESKPAPGTASDGKGAKTAGGGESGGGPSGGAKAGGKSASDKSGGGKSGGGTSGSSGTSGST